MDPAQVAHLDRGVAVGGCPVSQLASDVIPPGLGAGLSFSAATAAYGVNIGTGERNKDQPKEWLLEIEGMSFSINRSVDA
jgi:hypothetical protein